MFVSVYEVSTALIVIPRDNESFSYKVIKTYYFIFKDSQHGHHVGPHSTDSHPDCTCSAFRPFANSFAPQNPSKFKSILLCVEFYLINSNLSAIYAHNAAPSHF